MREKKSTFLTTIDRATLCVATTDGATSYLATAVATIDGATISTATTVATTDGAANAHRHY
ncbi:hypothetical protein L1277_000483 [Okibacterium sp. HSC-33S16]|uniref:hypothetical protein n=1 Tax=Okibacterium sp. HSC-33S16 TaxID=2910965 RepID=UPI00209CD6DB|nr:hypothetical protein [Okibacterium sp. HSC-33S16]MCP2030419.1 hypothetical protein [Okibacterium sp. HSC-33S16]